LARTSPSFEGLWWYDFQDDGWDPQHNEHNFGLVRPDLTPKPAYHVLADIARLLREGQYVGSVVIDDDHVRGLQFGHDERDYWVLWSTDDTDRQVVLETQHPEQAVTIQPLGYGSYTTRWGFRDWAGGRGPFVPNRLAVVVGHRPFMISGDLSGVTVADVVPRPREIRDGAGQ
jgi:hypothetical protein